MGNDQIEDTANATEPNAEGDSPTAENGGGK